MCGDGGLVLNNHSLEFHVLRILGFFPKGTECLGMIANHLVDVLLIKVLSRQLIEFVQFLLTILIGTRRRY
jgi:hypothetical protein